MARMTITTETITDQVREGVSVTMKQDGLQSHAGAYYVGPGRFDSYEPAEIVLNCHTNCVSALVHGKGVTESESTPDEAITGTTYAHADKYGHVSTFLHLGIDDARDLRDQLTAILRAADRDARI